MRKFIIGGLAAFAMLAAPTACAHADPSDQAYRAGHDEMGPTALALYRAGGGLEGACYSAAVAWMEDWNMQHPSSTGGPPWFKGNGPAATRGCNDYVHQHV
jgi:hypothetical protein